ncbi:alpha/beta hydrolase [Limobrevibacterium gyesilva]|uniref:Alpha/beta hydrolase n=1 Tax=Limobrevibacterium gyesilva TaxID=2991712 RepID=A0AA41YMU4_9PROT|nr:alpha/beta hydrolase [Limobrevibacterium gyesilva]MCW3475421.1 alpha/beta hydrolase [Limobrevibacterium gyesilva]
MTDLRALVARPGANDVPYEDPALPGRGLTLRSARPRHYAPDTPVLFVHHGVLRNGDDYRDFWLPLVDEAGLLVIAPQFPNDSFPGSLWYNFGNRADALGRPKPRAEWTYAVPGRIFAALQAQGVTNRRRYGLFGHSAGGQFVHRLISLGFRDNVAAAVTANAGTYAMPDLDTEFPYGLGATGMDDAALQALLAFRLTVMAGTADIDATSEHFPKEAPAMRQGGTRYERAHRYIATARAAAGARGEPCAWTIIDVPDVGHDGKLMSAAAAPILAAALHAAAN